MTLRRAFRWSFWIHVILVILLWRVDLAATRAREDAAQQAAVRQHEGDYQRTASANFTDRLRRMNELVERLDRDARQRESAADTRQDAGTTTQPPIPTPAAARPEPEEKPAPDLTRLWEESRRHHAAMRERYLERRAEALAELTHIDLEAARLQVQAEARDPLDGRQQAPVAAGEAASEIAALHADGQRMLQEALHQAKRQGEGKGLSEGSAREAYLLGQGAPGAVQTGGVDPVVDHTPLMASQGPRVNSELDTPEDLLRIARQSNQTLSTRFHAGRQKVRFTRRIGGTGARPAPWIAPDAWYIIGPFPNPWRSQIETAFPPELEIDRDAVYEGRDGRAISWKYVRTHGIGVIPPDMTDYAVYYAFTEINCAAPIDCWLAIGSDDYSKVWVNDLLVWRGAKNEKVWRPTEGFRRVHFDQGVNRLLVRLENGINGCEFSVVLALE